MMIHDNRTLKKRGFYCLLSSRKRPLALEYEKEVKLWNMAFCYPVPTSTL